MAQKVQVMLVDDLDGGQAEETISFALDGAAYEIDLSSKNAAKLRDGFAAYLNAARKVGRAGNKQGARRGVATADREQNQAIRAWAKKKGFKVSDRGRIPADVVEQYHAQR
jgi:hypothetical protein